MSESTNIYHIINETAEYERLVVRFAGETVANIFTPYGYQKNQDIGSLDLVNALYETALAAQLSESISIYQMTEKEYFEATGDNSYYYPEEEEDND